MYVYVCMPGSICLCGCMCGICMCMHMCAGMLACVCGCRAFTVPGVVYVGSCV